MQLLETQVGKFAVVAESGGFAGRGEKSVSVAAFGDMYRHPSFRRCPLNF